MRGRCHPPTRLDQIDQSQNSFSEPALLGAASVKVDLRSEIGGFGLVVSFGGAWQVGIRGPSGLQHDDCKVLFASTLNPKP